MIDDMDSMILTTAPDAQELAAAELAQESPQATIRGVLAPGVLLIDLAERFLALAERWRQQPPIFIRHICPVFWEIPLVGGMEDFDRMDHALADDLCALIDPELPFSVQARLLAAVPYKPFDLNRALADRIVAAVGAPLEVRKPCQVVSVVVGALPGEPLHGYVGLSLAQHNLSDWAGGVRRFAREPAQISRSEFKLLEALELFAIATPARGVALDLGAAPGGWTRVLRQRGLYVTAVDPAPLDPRLAHDRAIRYRPLTAQEYLASGPDTFDLIVNDMRMDARDSARLMVAYARYLVPDGAALITLKLPEREPRAVLDQALRLLERGYRVVGARQLFHNRSEVTVHLRHTSRSAPAEGRSG